MRFIFWFLDADVSTVLWLIFLVRALIASLSAFDIRFYAEIEKLTDEWREADQLPLANTNPQALTRPRA